MRKTKKNTATPRRVSAAPALKDVEAPHQKAALRSEAFARALENAKAHSSDMERLQTLFAEAAKKAATIPKDPFKENWAYLQAMLRFVRAYSSGDYPRPVDDPLLWIIAALNYLIDPFDLIPDEVPFLGFVDDATVVEFAVTKTRPALDEFMVWETTNS